MAHMSTGVELRCTPCSTCFATASCFLYLLLLVMGAHGSQPVSLGYRAHMRIAPTCHIQQTRTVNRRGAPPREPQSIVACNRRPNSSAPKGTSAGTETPTLSRSPSSSTASLRYSRMALPGEMILAPRHGFQWNPNVYMSLSDRTPGYLEEGKGWATPRSVVRCGGGGGGGGGACLGWEVGKATPYEYLRKKIPRATHGRSPLEHGEAKVGAHCPQVVPSANPRESGAHHNDVHPLGHVYIGL